MDRATRYKNAFEYIERSQRHKKRGGQASFNLSSWTDQQGTRWVFRDGDFSQRVQLNTPEGQALFQAFQNQSSYQDGIQQAKEAQREPFPDEDELMDIYLRARRDIPTELIYESAGPGSKPDQQRTATLPGDSRDPVYQPTWWEDFTNTFTSIIDVDEAALMLKDLATSVTPLGLAKGAATAGKAIANLAMVAENMSNYEASHRRLVERFGEFNKKMWSWIKEVKGRLSMWLSTRRAHKPNAFTDAQWHELLMKLYQLADFDAFALNYGFRHAEGNRLSAANGFY